MGNFLCSCMDQLVLSAQIFNLDIVLSLQQPE